MLEWYRVGWDHLRLLDETVELVRHALNMVGRKASLVSMTYRELFVDALSIDPFNASIDALRERLREIEINGEGLQRDDWLDLLITHRIQPDFPANRITVIRDWPATQCALARIRHDNPPVAERFELYLGPHELANGYHELTDPTEQRARFENDNRRRQLRGQRELPIDENLLAALESGLPACAGVALGIERLMMCVSGNSDIRELLPFSFADA